MLRPQAPTATPAGSSWRRSALILVLLAWSFLFERTGFLATSVFAYAAILVIANYDRWTPRLAIAYTAVGTLVLGGLYSMFYYLLQVPLPRGLLLWIARAWLSASAACVNTLNIGDLAASAKQ